MKRNDKKRSQKYQKFLKRHEKSNNEKVLELRTKRELKETLSSFEKVLNLDGCIEINMDGPKKLMSTRAHIRTMKKKLRKQKKDPVPVSAMGLI